MFSSSKNRFKTPVFEPGQVDQKYDSSAIVENTAYCRLWLDRMRLAQNVNWFQGRYPVVYSAIRYQYGPKSETVPHIAGVEFFQKMTKDHLDRVTTQSVALSPLFPYKTGLVELQAGLFSMKGSAGDPIATAITTMGRFSQLLGVPALSTVLNIIDPLYTGIEDLFSAGQSALELGYQQTFAPAGNPQGAPVVGSNILRPGYFAVIFDPNDQLKEEGLRIVNGDIHQIQAGGKQPPALLSGWSYMLFRVEKRDNQDWESLPTIRELVERAQDAILKKQQGDASDILAAIKVAIARSPDVVRSDRPTMFKKIEDDLKDQGLQAVGERHSLHEIMQRTIKPLTKRQREEWDRFETLFHTQEPAGR
jgi:hypothetical protein